MPLIFFIELTFCKTDFYSLNSKQSQKYKAATYNFCSMFMHVSGVMLIHMPKFQMLLL